MENFQLYIVVIGAPIHHHYRGERLGWGEGMDKFGSS